MKQIRGEDQPGFHQILSNWLPHQPWFPLQRSRQPLKRVGGLRLPAPEGEADRGLFIELHVFEVQCEQGVTLISVPLTLRSRPSALAGKRAFIGKLSVPETEQHQSQELWVYDGAWDRAFLVAWLEMARREQGSRNGRSRGEAYAGFDQWEKFEVHLQRQMRASEFENSTSLLVTPEGAQEGQGSVVVDVIRRPTAERDPRVEELLTLTEARSESIVRVLGLITGSWMNQSEEEPAWILGDLGLIRETVEESAAASMRAREALVAGKTFKQAARAMGQAVGTFHADLAGAFGAHPQGPEQLKTMSSQAQITLTEQWSQVRDEFDEDEAADIGEVIDLMSRQLRDVDEPLQLQHIHGSLGLEHLHRRGEGDWVLAEGGGFQPHALGLRDVVSVLMSVANLVMEVASETPDIVDTEDKDHKPVNFGLWYENLSNAFLAGYRDSDAHTAGVDSVFFRAAMLTEALELFRLWKGQWVFRPSMLLQVES